jgi:hypothetical protein
MKETGWSSLPERLIVFSTTASAISPEKEPVQLDDVHFTVVSIDS